MRISPQQRNPRRPPGEGFAGIVGGQRNVILVFHRIHAAILTELLDVGKTAGGHAPLPRFGQRRKKHRRQNRDDRDYNQEFNQSKKKSTPSLNFSSVCSSLSSCPFFTTVSCRTAPAGLRPDGGELRAAGYCKTTGCRTRSESLQDTRSRTGYPAPDKLLRSIRSSRRSGSFRFWRFPDRKGIS